jgi:hypothetical protein
MPSEFGFDRARYAIVLLAAISLPSFAYHTKKIQNTNFASYYNLYKIAKILGLEFERNRAAPNAYAELTQRRDAKVVVNDNRTFITFTESGRRRCEEILEDLQHLNEHINSVPLVRQKSREDEKLGRGTAKGVHASPLIRPEIKAEIDRLITKISQW